MIRGAHLKESAPFQRGPNGTGNRIRVLVPVPRATMRSEFGAVCLPLSCNRTHLFIRWCRKGRCFRYIGDVKAKGSFFSCFGWHLSGEHDAAGRGPDRPGAACSFLARKRLGFSYADGAGFSLLFGRETLTKLLEILTVSMLYETKKMISSPRRTYRRRHTAPSLVLAYLLVA